MSNNDSFKHDFRRLLLAQMKGEEVFDADELSLFAWYAGEHSKMIDRMLSEEKEFVRGQVESGADLGDVNASGMLAVEYYIKRARYADIIYMASLLESYLTRACERLAVILGDHNVIFRPDELAGDKWSKRKKFLEGYGRFTFPEEIWSNLQTLIRVRNILVHENGVSSSIPESKRVGFKRRGISIIQHKLDRKGKYIECELVIEKEYVDHCLSTFRSLVEFVDAQLAQSVDRSLQPKVLKQGKP